MARKVFDTWKIEITGFNHAMPYYVECDCGNLAKKNINNLILSADHVSVNMYCSKGNT